MPVSNVSPIIEYTANGVTTQFAFPFKTFVSSHLYVYVNSALQVGGYSVSGLGNDNGGTVTFSVAPSNGAFVQIVRDLPLDRTTDYQPAGAFREDQVDRDQDTQTMQLQQLARDIGGFAQSQARLMRLVNGDPSIGGRFDARQNRIINLLDPIDNQDAATKNFVKSEIANNVLTGVGVLPLPTYNALRAYNGTFTSVYVAGRTDDQDGAAGDFAVDEADTTSADNDGTILVDALGRRWKRQNITFVNVAWFGVKNNVLSTSQFQSAVNVTPSGGTLKLLEGDVTHILDKTIVFKKPIIIIGGAKEQVKIKFLASGSYLASPFKAGFIFPHTTTNVPSNPGDSRRSVCSGFTVIGEVANSGFTGVLICAPITLRNVDATVCTADGFKVAASNGIYLGNANGTVLNECYAYSNTGSGFALSGDDANACNLVGCRSFSNSQYGFFDDSLLGNTYVGCETDSNTVGGYYSTPAKPNRSVYLGCYAEGNQAGNSWNINARSLRIGSLGDLDAVTRTTNGVALSGMPSNRAYLNQALSFANTDTIANDKTGGAFLIVGTSGFEYKARSTAPTLNITDGGANYTDIAFNSSPVLRFPNADSIANIRLGRPYFPQGVSIGATGRSGIVGAGTAAPTTGTYDAGAIFFNDLPAASGFIGWVCVTAGTPGTWKTFGAISP